MVTMNGQKFFTNKALDWAYKFASSSFGESTTLSSDNGKHIMSALIYIKIAEVISQLAQ